MTSLQKLYIDTLNELDASDVHGMLTNLPKGLTELTLKDMEDPGNDLQPLRVSPPGLFSYSLAMCQHMGNNHR